MSPDKLKWENMGHLGTILSINSKLSSQLFDLVAAM